MSPNDPTYVPDPLDPTRTEGAAQKSFPPREALSDVGRELLTDAGARAVLDIVVRDFPHVVNRISGVWSEPARCLKVFDELLLDDRASRQGFPLAVVLELSDLRSYYEERIAPRKQLSLVRPRAVKPAQPVQKPDGIVKRIGLLFRR